MHAIVRIVGYTWFEIVYLGLESFTLPLYQQVRNRLKAIVAESDSELRILDVGGRKSPYTTGIKANVTVTDLPRGDNEVFNQLNLGLTDEAIAQLKERRGNIRDIQFDDMTKSQLSDVSFDCVVSVEVLEHVEEDRRFVEQVYRVLKPGGIFVMTTPNGDFVENTNPDHKRHYKRDQLDALLGDSFDEVQVSYAIVGGWFRRKGLRSWSPRRPVSTIIGMFSNVINYFQSAGKHVGEQSEGTRHLFAVAKKKRSER